MNFFKKLFVINRRKVHPEFISRQEARKSRLQREQSDVSKRMAKQYELIEELREEFNDISYDKADKSRKDSARQRLVNAEKKARHLRDLSIRLEDLAEVSVDIFSKIENMSDKSKEQKRTLKKKFVTLQKDFNSTLGKKAAIRSESAIKSSMKELDDFVAMIKEPAD